MRSMLQISNDLPDVLFAEMNAPGGHDRALRTVRFDMLANFDTPIEVSRVTLPVIRVGKVRSRWFEKVRPIRPTFTWLAVAGNALVSEQLLSGSDLCLILR